MDDKVYTYKAWLTTNEYKKIHDVHYDETFSLVTMLIFVQILRVIATNYDYKIWQMDVNINFLNGNLLKDMHMAQPKVFDIPEEAKKISKL